MSQSTLKGCIREMSHVVKRVHIDAEQIPGSDGNCDFFVTVAFRGKHYTPGSHCHFIARTMQRALNAALRDAK